MVGPFVQGMLLIGIIYWYSKGMMSMINDYYRSEFNRKLQANAAPKPKAEVPINVDNFMDYVRELETPSESRAGQMVATGAQTAPLSKEYSQTLLRFLEITGTLTAYDACLSSSIS
ncbi:uncharacterized protein LOC117586048 [Drosophila guanche]|uniref:Uncharacterized protein n=1 Tax=Drosophila guanche TaxID=7266 RepID=A0A3B0K7B7_DROGU|nr:uncharacterized protein LOC117586048 [Drosophila guanche]SPP83950.1 Hypothetical predicted protein [Drosophila guanche]